MLYTYSFANARRDLSDIFSTVIKDEPRFISNFKRVADATARKHEWLEEFLETHKKQAYNRAVYALKSKVLELFPWDRQFATISRASLSQFAKELTEGENK